MTRMTPMARMAHTVAGMARWLSDLADPFQLSIYMHALICLHVVLNFTLWQNLVHIRLNCFEYIYTNVLVSSLSNF